MKKRLRTVLLIVLGLALLTGGLRYYMMQTATPSNGGQVFSGALEDVTGGEALGVATAVYKNNKYTLEVAFSNLPEPNGTDFYEGWIVRKGIGFDVISTGPLMIENGIYVNIFTSPENLTDHAFYVLTLEPDDGDPAPAEHILEGTLK